MKKISAILVLTMVMLLAAGCSKKDNLEGEKVDATPTPTAEAEGTEVTGGAEGTEGTVEPPVQLKNEIVREAYSVEDYIKLGQYKDIEVTVEKLEVTEEDFFLALQAELFSAQASLVDVTDRDVIKRGDTVDINYEGLKDGVAFEGGTGQIDLLIGSGQFIEGFEEKLIGTKVGDKVELDLTFPEGYQTEELAGQPVVFNVTVNKLKNYELTEEYITANTEYKTMEEFKAGRMEELKASRESLLADQKANDVYNAIINDSEISSLPQSVLDYFAMDFKVYYSNYANSYGVDLEGFLTATGTTMERFDENAQEYAKAMATRELVMTAIAKAENIELTEDEYATKVAEYAVQYGFATPEEFVASVDESLLREDILYRKVEEFIVAEAIVL